MPHWGHTGGWHDKEEGLLKPALKLVLVLPAWLRASWFHALPQRDSIPSVVEACVTPRQARLLCCWCPNLPGG